MKFGIAPAQHPAGYAETQAQARLAEELGYDSVWIFEHHGVEHADGSAHYFPSPLLVLAGLATATRRIRLGSGVLILPFAHPLRVAEEVALLDHMSGGRVVLGVGTGYRRAEFDAFGVPYAERGARTAEALGLVGRLLAERVVTYRGRFYSLEGASVPAPVQRPRPPIWVGGWSAPAIRRAAALGDAWIGGLTADRARVAECIAMYRAALAAEGRDPAQAEVALEREVFVALDRGDAEVARRALERMYREEHVRWGHANVAEDASSFADLARDRFLVGDPDEVREAVDRYRELGVTHLVCRMQFPGLPPRLAARSMRLFAAEVMPAFRPVAA